jgi:hypothetical protein
MVLRNKHLNSGLVGSYDRNAIAATDRARLRVVDDQVTVRDRAIGTPVAELLGAPPWLATSLPSATKNRYLSPLI